MTSGLFKQAFDLHRRGRLAEAELGYRQVLAAEPNNPDALHFLGLLAHQSGRPAEAVPLIRQALAGRPNHPVYWYNLGHAHFALEEYAAAEQAFRRVVALAPTHAEALFHLGNMHRARGDKDGAVGYYRRAVAAKSDLVDAHANLGLLLFDIGHSNESVKHLEQAHRLRPKDPSILVNLGVARTRISSFQAAEAFRRALEIEPGNVDATLNLARVLSKAGRSDEAIEYYEAALARNPDSTALRMALANSLAEASRLDEAVRHYEAIIAANPISARPYLALGGLYRMFGRFEEAYNCHVRARELKPDNIEALIGILRFLKSRVSAEDAYRAAQLADDSCVPAEKRSHLHFALAACNESGGRYDAAFYHMDRAHELRRAELEPKSGAYDPKREAAKVDRIIAAFDGDYFVRTRSFGLRTELPVFIVGMPRSGTTLCEQVLASHPQIVGADELPDIPFLVHELRMSGATDREEEEEEGTTWTRHLTADKARALAKRHLSRLQALASGAARVVDKGPANYFHLGLIATLFPQARVIHCRRDPMDTGISCYSKDFALAPIWVSDLRSIGHVYRQYDRLMDHWRRILPINMLELQYEDVVADLEGAARRLIAYCGLQWDDRCLRFYETERLVKTASVEQVRRPIYDSSVGRWRKYERHLAPLREALEPHLDSPARESGGSLSPHEA